MAKIARNQSKEVRRLWKGIVPDGVMAALCEFAIFDKVAVGQKNRECLPVRFDARRVNREHIGPIREIGDAAEAFRLALRAENPFREIKAFERRVARGRDFGLDIEREPHRRIWNRERFAVDLVLSRF